MESPPTGDPGEGNRPIGALTMVTAAVCHLFRLSHRNPTYLRTRLNAPTGCTQPVTTWKRLNVSILNFGVTRLRSSWSTWPGTSLRHSGIVSSGGLLPCRRGSLWRLRLRRELLRSYKSVLPCLPQTCPCHLPWISGWAAIFRILLTWYPSSPSLVSLVSQNLLRSLHIL